MKNGCKGLFFLFWQLHPMLDTHFCLLILDYFCFWRKRASEPRPRRPKTSSEARGLSNPWGAPLARAPKIICKRMNRGPLVVPGKVLFTPCTKTHVFHCSERKEGDQKPVFPQNSMFPRPKGHFFHVKFLVQGTSVQIQRIDYGRRPDYGV